MNAHAPALADKSCLVIADVGSNHGQDLQRAKDTIAAAKASGANAVKFQSLRLDRLWHDPTPQIRKLHNAIDLEESWHLPLMEHARKCGIEFFSSPTYLGAVDILEAIGVRFYKLASAQSGTFPQMVERVAATGKFVIISTGISDYARVSQTVAILEKAGSPYAVLHCNSIYPTPPEKVHLPRMLAYKAMFGCPVGFSDHTLGWHIPVAAVAMGASIIEKHFTLDRKVDTPDLAIAITPDELKEMVRCIRETEAATRMLPRLCLEPEEAAFREAIRYRLVLREGVSAGQPVKDGIFDFLRHPGGIDAADLPQLQGARFSKDLPSHHVLLWNDINPM